MKQFLLFNWILRTFLGSYSVSAKLSGSSAFTLIYTMQGLCLYEN